VTGPIRSVGHGTLPADAFVTLLRHAGIEQIVDVRRYPGSRRHPHFGAGPMAGWLGEAGVAYHWEPRLGGRRRSSPTSPNTALRNAAFRAYADHMASAEFAEGMEALLGHAEAAATAVMCAESLWWHCHRRLVADALVRLHDRPVAHLAHDGRLVDHDPLPARVVDGRLVYDVE
jgi:uncharacterized protein (DUF488 family)